MHLAHSDLWPLTTTRCFPSAKSQPTGYFLLLRTPRDGCDAVKTPAENNSHILPGSEIPGTSPSPVLMPALNRRCRWSSSASWLMSYFVLQKLNTSNKGLHCVMVSLCEPLEQLCSLQGVRRASFQIGMEIIHISLFGVRVINLKPPWDGVFKYLYF